MGAEGKIKTSFDRVENPQTGFPSVVITLVYMERRNPNQSWQKGGKTRCNTLIQQVYLIF